MALEDIETAAAAIAPHPSVARTELPKSKPFRQPLPEHLPRHAVVHELKECSCPTGGRQDFLKAGTSILEVLDYVPASFRVVRHVQPRLVCKGCDTELRANMPSLPIARCKPGAGLVAHVLIAKYCDHLPLYRQSEIYAREGVELAARPWPIGLAKPVSCLSRSSSSYAIMFFPGNVCMVTIRRFQCLNPERARPKPVDYGSMSAMDAPATRRPRLLPAIFTLQTSKANIQGVILKPPAAFCIPMAMPDSKNSVCHANPMAIPPANKGLQK